MNKYWAGIGSRSAPTYILDQMTEIAGQLEKMGWWLRSGNAEGCDQSCALGVEEKAQIWLPWHSFNKEFRLVKPKHQYKVIQDDDFEAYDSIDRFHPNGPNLKSAVRRLMARNFRQCCGINEPNSSFVICWTEGGLKKGGTAQAIKIAESLNIPVFNLFNLTPEQILDKVAHG